MVSGGGCDSIDGDPYRGRSYSMLIVDVWHDLDDGILHCRHVDEWEVRILDSREHGGPREN